MNLLVYHGSLEPNHGTFKSRYFPGSGAQNRVRYWTGTPTLAGARFREPKRLSSFENLSEATHVSRDRRTDDFHGSTGLARRGTVGAASQIHREFTTEKSGKRTPFGGLNPRLYVTVNWLMFHGSLGAIRGTFKSRYFLGWGAQNSVRYRTGTPTLAADGIHKTQKTKGP